MSTEAQYSFFKTLYEEQVERTARLHEHSKSNLGLITLYSAFVLFAFDKDKSAPASFPLKAFFIATVLCLLISFLISLWATNITRFEAVNRPRNIVTGWRATLPTDEEFFEDRIVDYTVACERNVLVNDEKARQLRFARYFLLAAITLHAGYILLHLLK